MFGQDADAPPRAATSQLMPTFTPSRSWSSDAPQPYNTHINISQKLDRVLLMFEDLKRQVEMDSVETKEQLSLLHEDITALKEKHNVSIPKAKKNIPCDVSVRLF